MKRSIAFAAMLGLSLASMPAFAQTVNVSANLSASTGSTTVKTRASANIVAAADKEIAARVSALNELSAKIQSLKNVSASAKASLSAQIQTEIGNLNALKAKIDAETDAAALKTDRQSIATSFRIYALVMPEIHLLAAADRLNTVADMMASTSAKLAIRINDAKTAGKDTASMNASLSDMNAKIADVRVQAQAAVSGVSSLTPDNGDKTKMQANHAALVAARAAIKKGSDDLKAARKDGQSILKALKSLHLDVSATSTERVKLGDDKNEHEN